MRSPIGLALVCIATLSMNLPAVARPADRAHQPLQKQTVTRSPSQSEQRQASTPSVFSAARDLWQAARSNAAPALVAEARKYMGTNPTDRKRLWCAAFMNFVLAKLGYSGTNSDAAKSFASYGERIREPRVGAIAVLTRGRNGGHVGVVSGIDQKGDPIIISGNHSPRGVGEGVYARSRVIAYVLPTKRRARALAHGGRRSPSEPGAGSVTELLSALPHRPARQASGPQGRGGISDPLSELIGALERGPTAQRKAL